MKVLLATLCAISALNAAASDFKPASNMGIQVSAIELSDGQYKAKLPVIGLSYTQYLNNNISTRFSFGMSKGDKNLTVDNVDTSLSVRVKALTQAEIRYEVPITNSFSVNANVGATAGLFDYKNFSLKSSKKVAGLNAGVGLSWAIGRNSALHLDAKQHKLNDDKKLSELTLGYKFTF